MTVVFNVCSMQKYKIILSVVSFSDLFFQYLASRWQSIIYAAMI